MLKPTQLSSENPQASILDRFSVHGLEDKYQTIAKLYLNMATIISKSPISPAQKALALRHLLISRDAAMLGLS